MKFIEKTKNLQISLAFFLRCAIILFRRATALVIHINGGSKQWLIKFPMPASNAALVQTHVP